MKRPTTKTKTTAGREPNGLHTRDRSNPKEIYLLCCLVVDGTSAHGGLDALKCAKSSILRSQSPRPRVFLRRWTRWPVGMTRGAYELVGTWSGLPVSLVPCRRVAPTGLCPSLGSAARVAFVCSLGLSSLLRKAATKLLMEREGEHKVASQRDRERGCLVL